MILEHCVSFLDDNFARDACDAFKQRIEQRRQVKAEKQWENKGIFTHGDGDDRQWRLWNLVSVWIFDGQFPLDVQGGKFSDQPQFGRGPDARVGGMTSQEEGQGCHCEGSCGGFWLGLTENSSRGIVTGETGLTHTRATDKTSVTDSSIEARGGNELDFHPGRGLDSDWDPHVPWRWMRDDEVGTATGGAVDEEPKHSQTSSHRRPFPHPITYPLSMTRAATSSVDESMN